MTTSTLGGTRESRPARRPDPVIQTTIDNGGLSVLERMDFETSREEGKRAYLRSKWKYTATAKELSEYFSQPSDKKEFHLDRFVQLLKTISSKYGFLHFLYQNRPQDFFSLLSLKLGTKNIPVSNLQKKARVCCSALTHVGCFDFLQNKLSLDMMVFQMFGKDTQSYVMLANSVDDMRLRNTILIADLIVSIKNDTMNQHKFNCLNAFTKPLMPSDHMNMLRISRHYRVILNYVMNHEPDVPSRTFQRVKYVLDMVDQEELTPNAGIVVVDQVDPVTRLFKALRRYVGSHTSTIPVVRLPSLQNYLDRNEIPYSTKTVLGDLPNTPLIREMFELDLTNAHYGLYLTPIWCPMHNIFPDETEADQSGSFPCGYSKQQKPPCCHCNSECWETIYPIVNAEEPISVPYESPPPDEAVIKDDDDSIDETLSFFGKVARRMAYRSSKANAKKRSQRRDGKKKKSSYVGARRRIYEANAIAEEMTPEATARAIDAVIVGLWNTNKTRDWSSFLVMIYTVVKEACPELCAGTQMLEHIAWLKETFAEFNDKSWEDIATEVRDGLHNWNQFCNTVVAQFISSILGYVLLFFFHPTAMIKMTRCDFNELVYRFQTLHYDPNSLITSFWTLLDDILSVVKTYEDTRCIATAFIRESAYVKLTKDIAEVKSLWEMYNAGNLEQVKNMTEEEYLAFLRDVIDRVGSVSLTVPNALKRTLDLELKVVTGIYNKSIQTSSSSMTRFKPYCYLLLGKSQIGKTVMNRRLLVALLQSIGEKSSREYIYSVQEGCNFWDSYKSYMTGITYDDISNIIENLESARNLLRMVNNEPYNIEQAQIELKGIVWFMAKVVGCTTNIPDLCLQQQIAEATAIHNRFNVQIEMNIKKEYAHSDVEGVPGKLDLSKVPPEKRELMFPDIHTYTLYTVDVVSTENDLHLDKDQGVLPYKPDKWCRKIITFDGKPMKDIEIDQLLRYMVWDITQYSERQNKLLETVKKLDGGLVCTACNQPYEHCCCNFNCTCGKPKYDGFISPACTCRNPEPIPQTLEESTEADPLSAPVMLEPVQEPPIWQGEFPNLADGDPKQRGMPCCTLCRAERWRNVVVGIHTCRHEMTRLQRIQDQFNYMCRFMDLLAPYGQTYNRPIRDTAWEAWKVHCGVEHFTKARVNDLQPNSRLHYDVSDSFGNNLVKHISARLRETDIEARNLMSTAALEANRFLIAFAEIYFRKIKSWLVTFNYLWPIAAFDPDDVYFEQVVSNTEWGNRVKRYVNRLAGLISSGIGLGLGSFFHTLPARISFAAASWILGPFMVRKALYRCYYWLVSRGFFHVAWRFWVKVCSLFTTLWYRNERDHDADLAEGVRLTRARCMVESNDFKLIADNMPTAVKTSVFGHAIRQLWSNFRVFKSNLGIIPNAGFHNDLETALAHGMKYADPSYIQRYQDSLDEVPSETQNEHLIDILRRQVYSLTYGNGLHCQAIGVKTNTIVMPAHAFLAGADYYLVRRVTTNPAVKNARFKFTMQSDGILMRHGDILFYTLPQIGTVKDIMRYIPKVKPPDLAYLDVLTRDELGVVTQFSGSFSDDRGQVSHGGTFMGKTVTADGFAYMSNYGRPGFSGAPIVTSTQPSLLVGIHIAAGTRNGSTYCHVGAWFPSEGFCKDNMRVYYSIPATVNSGTLPTRKYDTQTIVHGISEKSIMFRMEEGHYNYYGRTPAITPFNDMSGVVPTVCASQIQEQFGGLEYGPPKLRGPDGKDNQAKWLNDLNKRANTAGNIPQGIVEWAVRDYLSGIPRPTKQECVDFGPMSEFEVLNGRDGVIELGPMNFQGSVGYPNPKPLKDICVQVERQRGTSYNLIDNEIRTEWNNLRRCYKVGKRYYVYHSQFPKIEPTPIHKDKVRNILNPEVVCKLEARRILLTVIAYLEHYRYESECAVGINPYGSEWDDLYRKFTRPRRCFAMDYGYYDITMGPQMCLAAYAVFYHVGVMLGYDESDLQSILGLAYDTTYPIVVVNGEVFSFYGSFTSGSVETSGRNSVANALLLRCAFYMGLETCWFKPAVTRFREYVFLLTYGDDNVGDVKLSCTWFDMRLVQEMLGQYGYIITDANKSKVVPRFIKLASVDFLKRGFKYNDSLGYFVGILDENSILKRLKSILKPKAPLTTKTITLQNIDSALDEWFLYGPKVYEFKRAKLLKAVEESPLKVGPISINTTYTERVDAMVPRSLGRHFIN